MPAGDPKVAYYNATRALFGSDDVGVIGVRADDVFAPSTIEKIARVTDALAKAPGVESALSITNVVDPFANVGLTSRLLPHIPPTPTRSRRSSGGSPPPPARKNLIADDFRGAAITRLLQEPDRRTVPRPRRRPADHGDPRGRGRPEALVFPTVGRKSYEDGAAQLSPDNRRLYLARSDGLNNRYSIQCPRPATGMEVWQTQRERDFGLTTLAVLAGRAGAGFGLGIRRPDHPCMGGRDQPAARPARWTHRLGCKLVFTRDGRRLISAATDQSIRFWDTSN